MRTLSIFLIVLLPFFVEAQSTTQLDKVVNPDRNAYDFFGQAVAIDQNWAIVGAPRFDSSGLGMLTDAGAVFFYKKNSKGNWSLKQIITAPDKRIGDRFGSSVTIYGRTAAVSSPYHDLDSNGVDSVHNAGAVYLYEVDANNVWNFKQKLVSSSRLPNNLLGISLSLQDKDLAIGSRDYLPGPTRIHTVAEIFTKNTNGSWSEIQRIQVPGATHLSGNTLAVKDSLLVVGDFDNDTDSSGLNPLLDAGAAYVFKQRPTGMWGLVSKLLPFDRVAHDWFSYSVGFAQDKIVIGSPSVRNMLPGTTTVSSTGAVYVFKENSQGGWSQDQKITAPKDNIGSYFGASLSEDDGHLAVGAPLNDIDTPIQSPISTAGAVYLFESSGSSWLPRDLFIAAVPGSNDQFGTTIAMDYPNILIGAMREDHDTNGSSFLQDAGSAYFRIFCGTSDTIYRTVCDSYQSAISNKVWTTSGMYADTTVNSSNCDSVIVLHLTVLQKDTSYLSFEICAGEEVQVGSSIYNQSGIYENTFTGSDNCDSLVITTLNVKPSIDVTLSLFNGSLLANSNSGSFQWYNCTDDEEVLGETGSVFELPDDDEYALIVIEDNCSDTSKCYSKADFFTSVDELTAKSAKTFKIYPNPFEDELLIEQLEVKAYGMGRIYDSRGALQREFELENQTESINLSELKAGFYHLQITSKGTVNNFKLVKR